MNYYDLVKLRHSVRKYNADKTIDKEVLLRILNAARLAPSAHNNQPWTFMVISSTEVLEKVHQAYEREWLKQAPMVIAIKGRKIEAWHRKFDEYQSLETDLTIAMDHLIMAATQEGLGTCWIAAFEPEKLASALKLEEDEVVYAITPLGYPSEEPLVAKEKTRKELDDMVEWL
jgi:nitroreductase